MRLHKACPVVTDSACRVVLYVSTAVLYHNRAILVVKVGYGEGVAWKVVKETLLCLKVVLHSLMEIHVVACEVSEDGTGKFQATDALLCQCM